MWLGTFKVINNSSISRKLITAVKILKKKKKGLCHYLNKKRNCNLMHPMTPLHFKRNISVLRLQTLLCSIYSLINFGLAWVTIGV